MGCISGRINCDWVPLLSTNPPGDGISENYDVSNSLVTIINTYSIIRRISKLTAPKIIQKNANSSGLRAEMIIPRA